MKAVEEIKRLIDKLASGDLPPDEPLFTLRARDRTASSAVRAWADWAYDAGSGHDKATEARNLADQMDAWPIKQTPGRSDTRTSEQYIQDLRTLYNRPPDDPEIQAATTGKFPAAEITCFCGGRVQAIGYDKATDKNVGFQCRGCGRQLTFDPSISRSEWLSPNPQEARECPPADPETEAIARQQALNGDYRTSEQYILD